MSDNDKGESTETEVAKTGLPVSAPAGPLASQDLVEELALEATKHVEAVGWKFLMERNTLGSLAAMSFGLFNAAWGFAPPAAVLLWINADIGSESQTNGALFSVMQTLGTTLGYMFVGRLSEIYGRRWVMLMFTLFGLIGSIVAGTANDLNTFIGANILLGLATGAQCCYAFLAGELMPNKHKMVGMAIVVIFCFPGTSMGAYLARSLVEHASWRWIYYIYIIAQIISLALYYFFYFPREAAQAYNKLEQTKKLDFVGIFFLLAGLVLFIVGIMTGGSPYPWKSAKVIGMVASGGISLIALCVWESFQGENAFFAVHLFKDVWGFGMNCIISAVGGISYTALSIIWPTQVSYMYSAGSSWQDVAAMSCTIGFGLWGGMVFLGPLWGPIGHPKMTLIVSKIWMVVFTAALANCNPDNKKFAIACSFLAALPIGFVEQQTGAIAQLVVPDKHIGTSFGTMGCVRVGVGVIGTAIVLAILAAKIPVELQNHVVPAALGAGLPETSIPDLFAAMAKATQDAMAAVPGINPAIIAAVGRAQQEGYAAAYRYIYYTTIPFGVVATAAAIALRPIKHLLTSHVPKIVEHPQQTLVNVVGKGDIEKAGA
ncbi:hypothetical protein EMPG_09549 [Blastomyces silverae]|uniref:Major facilitator superfamily (MFS) profile domain-containing protein n=1 Tax=Blastomyces silverae TaxID=2060906 RepID=A0A0H1BKY1_9EURO|nr:hypothetical protein EMPG_09549 [Blastomyces silverae]